MTHETIVQNYFTFFVYLFIFPPVYNMRKMFRKTNISNPQKRTRTLVYQVIINVSENFGYVLMNDAIGIFCKFRLNSVDITGYVWGLSLDFTSNMKQI